MQPTPVHSTTNGLPNQCSTPDYRPPSAGSAPAALALLPLLLILLLLPPTRKMHLKGTVYTRP